MKRRLILLGGGHAHVHVLWRAIQEPLAEVELVLVSPSDRHHYSGMVPGYLQGTYAEEDLCFDLRALTHRAGARFVIAAAERIDATGRTLDAAGERISFDLLSVNVGSAAAGLETPGVREHALTVRPMSRAVALRRRAEDLFATPGAERPSVFVVGAGAAGVELALALERLGRERGARPLVALVEATAEALPGFSVPIRRLTTRLLAERGVRLELGRTVSAIEKEAIVFDDGERERADLTVWVAGAAASDLFAGSQIPKDGRGYLLVDDTLRAADGSALFGAGDCIGFAAHPDLPKAGVFAVREAPILDHNLRATLLGGRLLSYRPQSSFLALLNTADGRAIWRWHGLSGHSRIAWWLKNRIDRGFVRRYQAAQ
ncbi:MAG: FAD-dependent oxidoreductase [Acidobacteriota bacterium]